MQAPTPETRFGVHDSEHDEELEESEYPEDFDDFDFDTDPEEDDSESAKITTGSGYGPTYGQPTRRPARERDGAFNALLWLLDGATGLVERSCGTTTSRLPEDFWVHAYAAPRQSLIALRAVLNDALDGEEPPQAGEQGAAAAPPPTGQPGHRSEPRLPPSTAPDLFLHHSIRPDCRGPAAPLLLRQSPDPARPPGALRTHLRSVTVTGAACSPCAEE